MLFDKKPVNLCNFCSLARINYTISLTKMEVILKENFKKKEI